jgi:hypothetical protein
MKREAQTSEKEVQQVLEVLTQTMMTIIPHRLVEKTLKTIKTKAAAPDGSPAMLSITKLPFGENGPLLY